MSNQIHMEAEAEAVRVSRSHTMCHNLVVTEVHKVNTTKTIPTTVPVEGNPTQPVHMQVRVAMGDKAIMALAKVSHYLSDFPAVILIGSRISLTIRHQSHGHITLCPEKLP